MRRPRPDGRFGAPVNCLEAYPESRVQWKVYHRPSLSCAWFENQMIGRRIGVEAGIASDPGDVVIRQSELSQDFVRVLAQGRWRSPGFLPGTAEREGKRSEEHTSELQSLMRISYAVFCLKKKN